MLFLSVVVFLVSAPQNSPILMLIAVLLLYVSNVLFSVIRFRERLLFLFLHLGIALFFLTRPVIGCIDPAKTWLAATQEATMFSLVSLYVSLAFLLIGVVAADAVAGYNQYGKERREWSKPRLALGVRVKIHTLIDRANVLLSSEKMRYIRISALLCFFVCLAGSFYVGLVKVSYMQGLKYEDYYLVEWSEHIPWAVDTLNVMMPFALCGYLAALPRKKPALAVLSLYVATTLPMLVIGSRADFVISFLFAVLYFVFRALTDNEEKWIKRRTVILAAVLVPLGVMAMGVINYTRAGNSSVTLNAFELLEDALFKQGVTFSVLGYGYEVNDQIQSLGFKFYTLGGLTNTITEGFIGTTFFGFEDLGSTNSARLALNGVSYSHAMSFFAHRNYLGGEGYGSSYILELYADFGMAGVAMGSMLLAIGLRALTCAMGRRWFWGMVALVSAMYVFHMPRGTALEWISFLWQTRFLLAVVLMMTLATILVFVSRLGATRHVQSELLKVLVDKKGSIARASGMRKVGKSCEHRNEYGLRVCSIR